MTFLEAGDAVLIPNPGYPTYRAVAEICGAEVREYDLTEAAGWLPDLEALAATDLSRVKLMLVNYPHMPTGTAAGLPFLTRLVAFAKAHNILLVHDNPYGFILNETPPVSLLAVPGAREVAVELNSLSKSHNMAGWRVGLLAGRADVIANVLRFKSNMDSGMFLPVQQAAVAALALGDDWFRGAERHLPRPPRVGAGAAAGPGLRARAGPGGPVHLGGGAGRLCRWLRPERRRAGRGAGISHAGRHLRQQRQLATSGPACASRKRCCARRWRGCRK